MQDLARPLPVGLAIAVAVALVVSPGLPSATAAVNDILSTTPVGEGPTGVAVATVDGGTYAYVTNSLSDTVSVVDTSTSAVIATIEVGDDPRGVAVNAAGTLAYVANFGSDTVSVINTTSSAVTSTIAVGDGPFGVAVNPAGTRLFVTNSLADTLSVIDPSTGADVVAPVAVGDDPRGVVADANFASVANYGSDTVTRFLALNNTTSNTISVGDGPSGIAIISSGFLAVTNSLEGTVAVYNASTRAQVGVKVTVGDDPRGVAVFAGGSRAYVTSFVSGSVSIIRLSTTGNSTLIGSAVTVGTGPSGIAINPANTRAFVANSAGTVSEIELDPPVQTFTLATPSEQSGTTGTFTIVLPATSSAGVDVVASSTTPAVCTLAGLVVTKLSAGGCTISATAAATTVGAIFYAEVTKSVSFLIVAPAGPQTITLTSPGTMFVGRVGQVIGVSNSGSGVVTVTSQTLSVCTVSNATRAITAVSTGTCTLKAAAAAVTTGPVRYLAASETISFDVVAPFQTITFDSPGTQVSSIGSFTVTAVSSADLPVVVASATPDVCTVSNVSGFVVTKLATGTCTLTATAASATFAGVVFPAASPVTHSFLIEDASQTVAFDDPGDQLSSVGTFTIEATSSAGLPVNVTSSTSEVCTVSAFTVTKLAAGTCTLTATAAAGIVADVTYAAAAPVTHSFQIISSPTSPTPPRTAPPLGGGPVTPAPPLVAGPVTQGDLGWLPPAQPTAVVGGRAVSLYLEVKNSGSMTMRLGNVNLSLTVPSGQGSVSARGGRTEVQVPYDGSTGLEGSGLLPGSTVQLFLPAQGSNSRELVGLPVGATGSFSGEVALRAAVNGQPLPVGRQVLQMVMVNENGEQTVVELTLNVAQPDPAPERDRTQGSVPGLSPGQSMATNGGQPERVRVTTISDQKRVTVEGDGWSMAIESEGVASSGDSNAAVAFVQGQEAAVSGDGFMPGTRADVWLFSSPTLLGSVEVDANGAFNAVVTVDGEAVEVGQHTLQVQGVGEDGYIRAANLGVTVSGEAPDQVNGLPSAFSWWWLVALVFGAVLVVMALLYRHKTRR